MLSTARSWGAWRTCVPASLITAWSRAPGSETEKSALARCPSEESGMVEAVVEVVLVVVVEVVAVDVVVWGGGGGGGVGAGAWGKRWVGGWGRGGVWGGVFRPARPTPAPHHHIDS